MECRYFFCIIFIYNKFIVIYIYQHIINQTKFSAFSGDKGRVQLLIDKAKNSKELVNSVDNSGYTALHYAARNGHEDICRILLQYGGLIDAPTRSAKSTPLHKAAVAGI